MLRVEHVLIKCARYTAQQQTRSDRVARRSRAVVRQQCASHDGATRYARRTADVGPVSFIKRLCCMILLYVHARRYINKLRAPVKLRDWSREARRAPGRPCTVGGAPGGGPRGSAHRCAAARSTRGSRCCPSGAGRWRSTRCTQRRAARHARGTTGRAVPPSASRGPAPDRNGQRARTRAGPPQQPSARAPSSGGAARAMPACRSRPPEPSKAPAAEAARVRRPLPSKRAELQASGQ